MMADHYIKPEITVIYYTANVINEHFANNIRAQLLSAIGGLPLISLSKKPLNFGTNICEGETERSIINVYRTLLVGAKAAKTKYIAFCEDDTLYPDEHFHYHLPPPDTFAYNMTRWNIHSWSNPTFYLVTRRILATLIAPRELFIEAIEERFAKYPDLSLLPVQWMGEPGRNNYEKALGVTQRKSEGFNTYNPLVVFSHPDSYGFQTHGRRKKVGKIRALEIPYWGTAEQVMKLYKKDAQ
ncbi:hypothetical protein A2966_03520 [Candidatus Roizmanbacteria bacterium RIFCSPLOWO2_01_FULL_41_22]|uniref:Uncharacterized protein n=1 Tax=Candidatus Roizmanbacteria bacterium RIFCSPLOWO2_01_FULL_41_22 TaxID=1802067 RepID=A0A1F7JAE6_9BACT|nr:MAG: hypothetical protein A2966_03520 [Candidatus Roizmanbacteria bacterium RIFCSPLOWO2_01_FULL_41_22]